MCTNVVLVLSGLALQLLATQGLDPDLKLICLVTQSALKQIDRRGTGHKELQGTTHIGLCILFRARYCSACFFCMMHMYVRRRVSRLVHRPIGSCWRFAVDESFEK